VAAAGVTARGLAPCVVFFCEDSCFHATFTALYLFNMGEMGYMAAPGFRVKAVHRAAPHSSPDDRDSIKRNFLGIPPFCIFMAWLNSEEGTHGPLGQASCRMYAGRWAMH